MMAILIGLLLAALLLAAVGLVLLVRRRNMHQWLPAYLRRRRPHHRGEGPVHVLFCFVDHFEPRWGGADIETERARVARWCRDYPRLVEGHRDADGRPPQHTFFYPEEEYRREHLDALVGLCAAGYGEIEVHLHHDDDTAENLRRTLNGFVEVLDTEHGALARDPDTGHPVYAFIHGNWCLDNSRADGRWCGVNNEIDILRETGCYADFTLPSAPSDTQTAQINSIYYATDDPNRPKSHDRGESVRVGGRASGDLMIIQGPLGLAWHDRKWGLIPRIENADLRRAFPPTAARVDQWVREGVHVEGRPEWVVVKVHTHGTQEGDMDTLLGEPVDRMFDHLERAYNDGERYRLHYVTARECYNIIKAAEAGEAGDPGDFRDYRLPPPPMRAGAAQADPAATEERSHVAS